MNKTPFRFKHFFFRKNFKQILGISLAVAGAIIIIQVVPIAVWLLMLGVLFIALGWTFFRMF